MDGRDKLAFRSPEVMQSLLFFGDGDQTPTDISKVQAEERYSAEYSTDLTVRNIVIGRLDKNTPEAVSKILLTENSTPSVEVATIGSFNNFNVPVVFSESEVTEADIDSRLVDHFSRHGIPDPCNIRDESDHLDSISVLLKDAIVLNQHSLGLRRGELKFLDKYVSKLTHHFAADVFKYYVNPVRRLCLTPVLRLKWAVLYYAYDGREQAKCIRSAVSAYGNFFAILEDILNVGVNVVVRKIQETANGALHPNQKVNLGMIIMSAVANLSTRVLGTYITMNSTSILEVFVREFGSLSSESIVVQAQQ